MIDRSGNDWAVRFEGVEKVYPHFRLDGIDLEVPTGSVLGLIGPNGAGKSTTLRILMGLVHQDRGRVEVLGHSMPSAQVPAKWETGFFSEDMALYGHATLAWHLGFMASIFETWDGAYADALVRRFGLRAEQKIQGLSHGQRVKAALLLVLARRPRLVVLDEPTNGLDPVARKEVMAELIEILADEERTILFSSHNTLDVEQISDRITFLDQGQVVDSQDKETYLDRWRRLRLDVGERSESTEWPGIVEVQRRGRLLVGLTDCFDEALLDAFRSHGATIQGVERLSLEEIFVATVSRSREERS